MHDKAQNKRIKCHISFDIWFITETMCTVLNTLSNGNWHFGTWKSFTQDFCRNCKCITFIIKSAIIS
jgi:hypothetical protein